jgi:D-alanyl-lipoteichoic acid acyltransferase DltB (MBOAT superfamily)
MDEIDLTGEPLNLVLFFIVVLISYYILHPKIRWVVLLAASVLFYYSFNSYYLLFAISYVTMISYCFGIFIKRCEQKANRKCTLFVIGIILSLVPLIALRYFRLLEQYYHLLFGILQLDRNFTSETTILALGVSYYTFQALSYLIDIYMKDSEPETHFGYYALYISFFPKVLQGPIERAEKLLPQLRTEYRFRFEDFRSGIFLIVWGLFKKMVVADRLALFVDAVYGNLNGFQGAPLVLATYLYAAQLYFDFSGYTDIALGTARTFGINLTQNFNSPYLAKTIADFWRRWHISFSRWILDYIFMPLNVGLRNLNRYGTAIALIVTFLVSGIWHGASVNFIIWGLLHGIFLAISVFYQPVRLKYIDKIWGSRSYYRRAWQIFVTFHLVCFTWIFFRASSLSDALYIINNIFTLSGGFQGKENTISDILKILCLNQAPRDIFLLVFSMLILVFSGVLNRKYDGKGIETLIFKRPFWVQWSALCALSFSLILFSVTIRNSFIYATF